MSSDVLLKALNEMPPARLGGIENLGHPLALLLRELFKKRPLFAAKVMGESKSRDFLTKAELDLVRSFLNEKTVEESWEYL
jgi:hypothetical protein